MALTIDEFEEKYGWNPYYDMDLSVGKAMSRNDTYQDECKLRCSLRRQLRKIFQEIDPNMIVEELAKVWDKILYGLSYVNITSSCTLYFTWLKSLKLNNETKAKLSIVVPTYGYDLTKDEYYGEVLREEDKANDKLYFHFSELLRKDIEEAKESVESTKTIPFELHIITEDEAKKIKASTTLNNGVVNDANFPDFEMDKLME